MEIVADERGDPIVEAVLEITVELPSDLPLKKLLDCQRSHIKDYPEVRETSEFSGQFTFGQKISSSVSSESNGYAFWSKDQKQLFQAKRTTFAYNRLAPYNGWSKFFSEAKKLWDTYRKTTHPKSYKRLGLRYINKFDIPTKMVLLEKYFRTFPEVSSDLPQVMNGFFFSFNLMLPEIDAEAKITQTMVPNESESHSSVILDIDVSISEAIPSGPDLMLSFEKMREWHNKIFFACLTEELLPSVKDK